MSLISLTINGKNALVKNDRYNLPVKYSNCYDMMKERYFLNIWSPLQFILSKSDIWDSKDGDILILKFENSENNKDVEYCFKEGYFWNSQSQIRERCIREAFIKKYGEPDDFSFSANGVIKALYGNYLFLYNCINLFGKYHFHFRSSWEFNLNKKDVSDKKVIHEYDDSEDFSRHSRKDEIVESKDKQIDISEPPEQESYEEYQGEVDLPDGYEIPNEKDGEDDEVVFSCARECYFSMNGVCKFFDWQCEDQDTGQEPNCKEPFLEMEKMRNLK